MLFALLLHVDASLFLHFRLLSLSLSLCQSLAGCAGLNLQSCLHHNKHLRLSACLPLPVVLPSGSRVHFRLRFSYRPTLNVFFPVIRQSALTLDAAQPFASAFFRPEKTRKNIKKSWHAVYCSNSSRLVCLLFSPSENLNTAG